MNLGREYIEIFLLLLCLFKTALGFVKWSQNWELLPNCKSCLLFHDFNKKIRDLASLNSYSSKWCCQFRPLPVWLRQFWKPELSLIFVFQYCVVNVAIRGIKLFDCVIYVSALAYRVFCDNRSWLLQTVPHQHENASGKQRGSWSMKHYYFATKPEGSLTILTA